MGQLKEKLLDSYPVKPTLWYRFIDDIFCIFPANLTEAQKFIDYLNTQHHSIKFTAEISNKSVNFLDTTISREWFPIHHVILKTNRHFQVPTLSLISPNPPEKIHSLQPGYQKEQRVKGQVFVTVSHFYQKAL